jgi:hypothetical protein
LFEYISGANTGDQSISMTAPVTQKPASDDGAKISMTAPVAQTETPEGDWQVAFYLPRDYTTETAPKPTDDRVSIISVPGERVVAIRFSGFWSDSNYAEHNAELQAFIAAEGLITEGEPIFAYYNAPFVPWFLRRNEVIYRLAGTPE